ncbi:MAG: hypothetical protein IKQ31_02505 [Clostridia bacterium]|nr:hypothetical protein [Clostridia bacterium]
MPLEKLKCDECGGELTKTQSDDNTYICLYCGNKVVVKPEIHNINNNTTQNITKNIYGNDGLDYEELIKNGIAFINLGDFAKAIQVFSKCIDSDPTNYKAWWLRAKAKLLAQRSSEFLEKYAYSDYEKDFNNAKKVCPTSDLKRIEEDWYQLINGYSPDEYDIYQKAKTKKGLSIVSIVFIIVGLVSFWGTLNDYSMENSEKILMIIFGAACIISSVIFFIISKLFVIKTIKKHNEISLKDIMILYNKKYESVEEHNKIKQKIENWIANGKLLGYKFDGEKVYKIDTEK